MVFSVVACGIADSGYCAVVDTAAQPIPGDRIHVKHAWDLHSHCMP
ncbi:MAG: hypothetical protein OJF60_002503 [Burkholderiaceae bacterium]|nr:MAG: hypothetical protein OJF60_002503 [Burkholderiaceae bacterium]